MNYFGILAFCCLGDTKRELISDADLREYFPDYVCGRLPKYYVLDEEERFAYVHVEQGKRTIDAVVRRCENIVLDRRRRSAGFRKLIDAGQFYLWVVTPSERRATLLRSAFDDRHFATDYGIAVVSELESLLVKTLKKGRS